MRIFECPAYAHVNDGKLAPRGIKCMFLVYAFESKGYCLWYLDFKKVIQIRGVTFNESTMFSTRKESIVFFTSTGDHHDTSDKMELEFPTQGGATSSSLLHLSSEVHIDEPDSSSSGPNEP